MKIEQRNPTDLHAHKRIKNLHRWDPKDERFTHFVVELKEIGIKQPLQITARGEVIDGELRRQVAVKAKLETVPCVVVPDDEISAVILGSICSRRHYTKGQRAYMLAPEMDAAFQEGAKRNWEALKAGGKSATPLVNNKEFFAEQYGISAALIGQARQVHKLFTEDPAFAKQMEPKIFDEDRPAGLGAIIAGHAGQKSTKGGKLPRPSRDQKVALFCKGLEDQAKRFVYLEKLPEEDWDKVVEPRVRLFAAAMSPPLLLAFKRAIKSAEREAAAAAGMEAA